MYMSICEKGSERRVGEKGTNSHGAGVCSEHTEDSRTLCLQKDPYDADASR